MILIFTLVVALISVFPHLFAFFTTPKGDFFTGFNFLTNHDDVQGVYFAAIHNFAKGDWLYRNPFSPNPLTLFHYPVYLVIGKIAAIFHLSTWVAYLAAIFVLCFPFCFLIFHFFKRILKDNPKAFLAFGLAIFGGLFPFSETAGLFTLQYPHFIVSSIGIFSFLYSLYFLNKNRFPLRLLAVFASSLLIGFAHPWMLIPLCTFSFLWTLILYFKKESWRKMFFITLTASATALPFLIYYGNAQKIPWVTYTLTIKPLTFISVLGVGVALAAYGLVLKGKKYLFFALWLLIQVLFVFLPFPFRRKFAEGIYFPLALFSVFGIEGIIHHFKIKGSKYTIYLSSFLALSLGTIALYLLSFVWLPNKIIYKKLEVKQATLYLDKKATPSQRVFSLAETGVFLSGEIDANFFVGHNMQTADYAKNAQVAIDFYRQGTNPNWKNILLRENICYVYRGPEEKALGGNINANYLTQIFKNNEVEIYQTSWCK